MNDGTLNPEPSLFWQAEHPAKRSLLSANEKDFPILVVNWPLSICDLLNGYALAGWCGKMCVEPCTPTEDGTWEPSSGTWATSAMGGATECWTLGTSESLNPADESFSWASIETVLETGDIPQRFYMTPKACAGMERRNLRRGMKLSDALHRAVQSLAATWQQKKECSDSTHADIHDGSCLWKLSD